MSGTESTSGASRDGEDAAVEVEADDLRHHLGRGPEERDTRQRRVAQIVVEFLHTLVDAEKGVGGEPRGDHALRDEHAFGDDQTASGGASAGQNREVGSAVHRVEVTEVLDPGGILRVVDVDHFHCEPGHRNSVPPGPYVTCDTRSNTR